MTKPTSYGERLDAYVHFLVLVLIGIILLAAGYPLST
jgi:hypothetical protein